MQVRVDEFLGIVLGPVDVLEGGEVEDHVGACAAELGFEPRGLADVAEDVRDPFERLGRALAPVGDQRPFVTVEQGDVLRPEPGEEGREHVRDRSAAACDEDAPAAETLLQLEH